jgi:hypothetical protein
MPGFPLWMLGFLIRILSFRLPLLSFRLPLLSLSEQVLSLHFKFASKFAKLTSKFIKLTSKFNIEAKPQREGAMFLHSGAMQRQLESYNAQNDRKVPNLRGFSVLRLFSLRFFS